jgi:hypothetical protein
MKKKNSVGRFLCIVSFFNLLGKSCTVSGFRTKPPVQNAEVGQVPGKKRQTKTSSEISQQSFDEKKKFSVRRFFCNY